MANSGVSARHIGEAISSITDALTIRLIEMAEAELGPPPVPYVWLCGGSQARGEQSSHSDQDNALLISDRHEQDHARDLVRRSWRRPRLRRSGRLRFRLLSGRGDGA